MGNFGKQDKAEKWMERLQRTKTKVRERQLIGGGSGMCISFQTQYYTQHYKWEIYI